MSGNRAGPGLVQIYTGDGKGKTTAAIGLLVRAAGRGRRSCLIQFMKEESVSGEVLALERLPEIEVSRIGLNTLNGHSINAVKKSLKPALKKARAAVEHGYDLVVLDEVIYAGSAGFVSSDDVLAIIAAKSEGVELVLTGRGADDELIAAADLVTEMLEVKHPYRDGLRAREGIEY